MKQVVKGCMVVSGYLLGAPYEDIYRIYLDTAQAMGIRLDMVHNCQLHMSVRDGQPALTGLPFDPDFILFLDKDILLARHLETMGYRVFNSAQTIALCDNKAYTLQALYHAGIAVPETVFPPFAYRNSVPKKDYEEELYTQVEQLGYPLVVKENYGSHGKQVYLVNDRQGLMAIRQRLFHTPHHYQAFIASSAGTDTRLAVVGDEVVAAMRRYGQDFRANLSLGGRMEPFEPPEAFREMALKATKALGADFAGVDILFGEQGEPILCEVNSNAHIKNIMDCTGVNVAARMLTHILDRIG